MSQYAQAGTCALPHRQAATAMKRRKICVTVNSEEMNFIKMRNRRNSSAAICLANHKAMSNDRKRLLNEGEYLLLLCSTWSMLITADGIGVINATL